MVNAAVGLALGDTALERRVYRSDYRIVDVGATRKNGWCHHVLCPSQVGSRVVEQFVVGPRYRMQDAAVEVDARISASIILPELVHVEIAARVQVNAEVLLCRVSS